MIYFYAGKMRKDYKYLNMDSPLPTEVRTLDHQTLHQPVSDHCRKLVTYVLQVLHSGYQMSYGNTTVLRCRKLPTSFCIEIRYWKRRRKSEKEGRKYFTVCSC